MNQDFLDRYSRMESPIHRLPAGLKMAAALLLILSIVLMPPQWLVFAGIAAGLLIVAVVSRVPLKFLGHRLLVLEPLVLGVAVLSWFQPHGGMIFALIMTKSSLCLATMILLANTTSFAAMLTVLRRVRVPGILVTTLALMYRYLSVLADEGSRMQRARLSRTFTKRRGLIWRSLASVIGQLFVRSTERAERIYAAMCSRGWR